MLYRSHKTVRKAEPVRRAAGRPLTLEDVATAWRRIQEREDDVRTLRTFTYAASNLTSPTVPRPDGGETTTSQLTPTVTAPTRESIAQVLDRLYRGTSGGANARA